jgi:hypothetical protein
LRGPRVRSRHAPTTACCHCLLRPGDARPRGMGVAAAGRGDHAVPQRDRPLRDRRAPRDRHRRFRRHARGRGHGRRRALRRHRRNLGADDQHPHGRRLRHLLPAPLVAGCPRRRARVGGRPHRRRRHDRHPVGHRAPPPLRSPRRGDPPRVPRPTGLPAATTGRPGARPARTGTRPGPRTGKAGARPRADARARPARRPDPPRSARPARRTCPAKRTRSTRRTSSRRTCPATRARSIRRTSSTRRARPGCRTGSAARTGATPFTGSAILSALPEGDAVTAPESLTRPSARGRSTSGACIWTCVPLRTRTRGRPPAAP